MHRYQPSYISQPPDAAAELIMKRKVPNNTAQVFFLVLFHFGGINTPSYLFSMSPDLTCIDFHLTKQDIDTR